MKKLLQYFFLILSALIFSCEDEMPEPALKKAVEHASLRFAQTTYEITSIVNFASGENMAVNYDWSAGEEKFTGSRKSLNATVLSCTEIFAGTDPFHVLEVNDTLMKSFALTGIGARVAKGDVTTLWFRGQDVDAETGALGDRHTWKFGSEPNKTLEVWYEVPPGMFIVGLGWRVNSSYDITTLKVYYRQWDSDQKKFVGAILSRSSGTNPNHATEVEWGTWYNLQDADAINRTIITGIGLRCAAGDMTTLKATLCTIPE